MGENATADPKKCYLEVIGFPCNQFGHQEPSENYELMNTLKYVRPGYGFVPNFPLVGKLEVNGMYESPIFTFLKVRAKDAYKLFYKKTIAVAQGKRCSCHIQSNSKHQMLITVDLGYARFDEGDLSKSTNQAR